MVQEIRSLQKLAIFFRVSRWGRRGGACTRYFTVIELATCTLKFGMGKSTITTLKKNEPKIRGFVSKPPVLPSRQVYAFMYGYSYPLRWPVFWMVDLLRTSLPRAPSAVLRLHLNSTHMLYHFPTRTYNYASSFLTLEDNAHACFEGYVRIYWNHTIKVWHTAARRAKANG